MYVPKSMVRRQYLSVVQIMLFPSSSYIMLQSLTSKSFWEQQKTHRYLWSVKGVWPRSVHSSDVISYIHSLWQTSAFKGIGNIWPMKLLLTDKAFQDALSKLGDTGSFCRGIHNYYEWQRYVQECQCSTFREKCSGKSVVAQMVPKSTSTTHQTY